MMPPEHMEYYREGEMDPNMYNPKSYPEGFVPPEGYQDYPSPESFEGYPSPEGYEGETSREYPTPESFESPPPEDNPIQSFLQKAAAAVYFGIENLLR